VEKSEAVAACSDDDLLALVAEGDRDAFGVLMRKYLARMVCVAQRIVLDRELAREIVQEAFLRVWRLAGKWDPEGEAAFSTWLCRVVMNLSISQRRRFREQVDIDVIEEFPSDSADGFDVLAAFEEKKVVGDALRLLPERQRAALALYYFDEMSQVEAAEAMDLSPRAFDSLIVRARANLKKRLTAFGVQGRRH
jgi:RNA polymerase sigma-70 factor (ECF subfamily)